MNKEVLMAAIKAAEVELVAANLALENFEGLAENNVFATMQEAEWAIEGKLRGRASEDCEGSYNCGAEVYEQEFIVDGKKYNGIATFEYNRHDKTYYYIDSSDFRVVPL